MPQHSCDKADVVLTAGDQLENGEIVRLQAEPCRAAGVRVADPNQPTLTAVS